MRLKAVLTGLLLLALAACSAFPRGAGMQREVLGGAAQRRDAESPAPARADFAIAAVTRDRLATYAAWPAVGESTLGWIPRVSQPQTRIIAAGDSLAVSLWSTEDNGLLTGPGQRFVALPPMRVAANGTIFLPYIGQMRLAGMSVEHARARIEQGYVAVTPSAQVQLALVEGRQSSVSLIGGVTRPGPYPLTDQDVTLLELLAAGGGVTPGLANPQIRLQRGSRLFGTSMQHLLETPAANTTLVGGDKIYVEEDKRYFLSLGAAGKEAQIRFPQDQVSALDALSLIGGVADSRADPKGILVLRTYPAGALRRDGSGPSESRTVFTIDLTSADGLFSAGQFRIRAGDLVYVTESPLIRTQSILGLIGSAFGIARQAELTSVR